MSEQGTTKAKLSCHAHPRYKAIRKPRPGCVLCHAMWQDRLVEIERTQQSIRDDGYQCVCGYGCPPFQGCRHD